MKELKVEVMGPVPPCYRCQAVKEAVEKVAERLKVEGIDVEIGRANIASKEVVRKYGVLFSPALVVNGNVRIMGRVPSEEEVEALIRDAAK